MSDGSAPPLPEEELPPTVESQYLASHSKIPLLDQSTNESELHTKSLNDVVSADPWQAIFDAKSKTYYFHNTDTGATTWDNPRAKPSNESDSGHERSVPHGYTTHFQRPVAEAEFSFQARFDRRTGKFIADASRTVENHSVSARAARQLSRYVDEKSIEEDGRSLRAERRAREHTKEEIKLFKQKHKEKRNQRRRAWLVAD